MAAMLEGAPEDACAAIIDSVHTRVLPQRPSLLLSQEVLNRAKALLGTLDAKGASETTNHVSTAKGCLILGTLPNKDTGENMVTVCESNTCE